MIEFDTNFNLLLINEFLSYLLARYYANSLSREHTVYHCVTSIVIYLIKTRAILRTSRYKEIADDSLEKYRERLLRILEDLRKKETTNGTLTLVDY